MRTRGLNRTATRPGAGVRARLRGACWLLTVALILSPVVAFAIQHPQGHPSFSPASRPSPMRSAPSQYRNSPGRQPYRSAPQYRNAPTSRQYKNTPPPPQQHRNAPAPQQYRNTPPLQQQNRTAPPPQQYRNVPPSQQQYRNTPPPQQYRGGAPAPKGHLGDWLQRHQGSPQDQARALRGEPGFNRLPPQQQQRLEQRLRDLNNMRPEQRQRTLQRMENMERLSPQQRDQVRRSAEQLSQLAPERQQVVRRAFRDLRGIPPGLRHSELNSPRYSGQFTPPERNILDNLLQVEPYQPSAPPSR